MKILYGVQGTGNGHLARARALAPELNAQGIEVDFVFSGREPQDFFNMEAFGQYRCFKGLTLVTEKGKLKPVKTALSNNILCLIKDAIALNVSDYDLIISDFEPITAWAAKLRGVKSISISHQAAFDQDVPKVPGHFHSRLIMKLFAPTRFKLGLHWGHFNQTILPPIIEPLSPSTTEARKILVYMGFEDVDAIKQWLNPMKDYNFQVFAKVAKASQHGHISINPLSHTAFHQHLVSCEGVIANAGFELASECLHLGKKLLTKPVDGQFEQLCNAKALVQLNRATVINSLDATALEQWLCAPPQEATPYPNVAKAISYWLFDTQRKSKDFSQTSQLMRQLWHERSIAVAHS